MLYKTPGLATELPFANPEIRLLAQQLDEQLHGWGLGDLVVTDILRDPKFYAEKQFSWHFCGNAIDLRVRDYTDESRARIIAWLQGWTFDRNLKWDVVPELTAPRGPHIHVEVEDADWLRRWEQRTGQNFGRGNA